MKYEFDQQLQTQTHAIAQKLFPHIDTTVIKDISDGLNDLKGDRLIAIYARSDELKK